MHFKKKKKVKAISRMGKGRLAPTSALPLHLINEHNKKYLKAKESSKLKYLKYLIDVN